MSYQFVPVVHSLHLTRYTDTGDRVVSVCTSSAQPAFNKVLTDTGDRVVSVCTAQPAFNKVLTDTGDRVVSVCTSSAQPAFNKVLTLVTVSYQFIPVVDFFVRGMTA